jgi:hypothetical protein
MSRSGATATRISLADAGRMVQRGPPSVEDLSERRWERMHVCSLGI